MSELERLREENRTLHALYELAGELLRLEEHDALLDAVVQRSMALLHADRGFLVLRHEEELDFKVVRNWSPEAPRPGAEPVSRAILDEALRGEHPILVEDALLDPRFGDRASVVGLQIRSVLAAPLRVGGHVAGALYLEAGEPQNLFGPDQLGLFEQILELSSRALERCVRHLMLEQRAALAEKDLLRRHDFAGIVTRDPALLRVLKTVAQVAPTDLAVLVQGASGTGKELIARALHLNSRRVSGPFVTINCGAIAPALLESELFGHVKGAFTGAIRDTAGLLRTAHRGTVFLDEIGELPRELQVKLLRALQFSEVQPVGGVTPVAVDVRVIAASNRDLAGEVREGRFREDLYFRLNAVTLELPPLRSRPGDVLLLFQHFLRRAAERMGRKVPEVTPRVERLLEAHAWPGNVRELENEAARAVALTPEHEPITAERLSARLAAETGPPELPERRRALAARERELVELHLRRSGGNRTQAARTLGLTREGLRKTMKRLGMA
jgi:transcriptional regulator with GAF, ATPase, and Fis domain